MFLAFPHGHGRGFWGCQVLSLMSDDGVQRVGLLLDVSGRSLNWCSEGLVYGLCRGSSMWIRERSHVVLCGRRMFKMGRDICRVSRVFDEL